MGRPPLAEGREYVGRYRYLRPDGTVTLGRHRRPPRSAPPTAPCTRWLGSVSDVTEQVEAARRLRGLRAPLPVGGRDDGRGRRAPGRRRASSSPPTRPPAGCWAWTSSRCYGGRSVDPRWRAVREDGSDFPADERPAAGGSGDRQAGARRDHGCPPRPTGRWPGWRSTPSRCSRPGRTASSAVVGVVTTFSDVTAQRAASRALARSEEQFRSAMAHAPVGMALVGLDGTFTEVNHALCRLLGYDEAELLGRTFQELTHAEDLELGPRAPRGADGGAHRPLHDGEALPRQATARSSGCPSRSRWPATRTTSRRTTSRRCRTSPSPGRPGRASRTGRCTTR